MRILGTIALCFLTILSALLFLLSSTCVVASGVPGVLRILGLVLAVAFGFAALATIKAIATINRNPNRPTD
jgi:hypothetical protein